MITNKDVRVENGNIVINGDKYPLDGQSPEAIMQIVEDNSDTTPTENSKAPITSGGVFTALGTKQDTLIATDITSSVTIDNTAVSEAVILTYGKLLYVYVKLKPSLADQAIVISNLPKIKTGTGCVLPAFYLNRGDYNKGCVCMITNGTTSASVQFRCGDTPTGASGTMYSGVCILDE